jgi:hypothetical protein
MRRRKPKCLHSRFPGPPGPVILRYVLVHTRFNFYFHIVCQRLRLIMPGKQDVEAGDGDEYASYRTTEHEREALLPTTSSSLPDPDGLPPKSPPSSYLTQRRFNIPHLVLSFLAGCAACLLVQSLCDSTTCLLGGPTTSTHNSTSNDQALLAPPYVGSTVRHPFPPPSPTNANPTLFPTSVGYPGGTPTGAEPAIIATAPSYPIHSGAPQLIDPGTLGKPQTGSHNFDIFRKWGNLSPWYSVDRTAFGLDSSPETPDTCRVTGLHLLHRHGARYPTAWCEFFVRCFQGSHLTAIWNGSFVWRACKICDESTQFT